MRCPYCGLADRAAYREGCLWRSPSTARGADPPCFADAYDDRVAARLRRDTAMALGVAIAVAAIVFAVYLGATS